MSALSPAREIAPFNVVRDFEAALCEYTGAPYAVTVTSCTAALTLACAWSLRSVRKWLGPDHFQYVYPSLPDEIAGPGPVCVEIPKRTYVGVPYAIREAGGRPTFRDENWRGFYQLKPLPVWDCARLFTANMCDQLSGGMYCVSFHWTKTLGIQQGGAILHDDPKPMRGCGARASTVEPEGVPPAEGHVPASPRVALLHEPGDGGRRPRAAAHAAEAQRAAAQRRLPGPFAARGLPMNRTTTTRADARREEEATHGAEARIRPVNIQHGHTDDPRARPVSRRMPITSSASPQQVEAFIAGHARFDRRS
jgi:hypothetical protein